MAGNRVYSPFQIFNLRIVNMQHLWSPSTEYLGQPTQKPNYFITAITAKTRANWWEEPLLAPAWAAYDQLLQKSGMTPQHVSEWPIKDGDMPPEPGKQPSEWAKGHWILGGSSSSPIKAEMVQNGNVVPLPAKIGVKPGDFVALGCSAAIKQNNPRAIKHFCNTVLFTAAGEEIAVGNSVSGAELMRTAQGQGLQVAGFSSAPGGFAAPGQPGGFPGGGYAPQGGPGGFQQPQGGPGFTPPGPGGAPMGMAGGQPGPNAFPGAPAPGGPGFGGSVTYPSSPTGQPGPGFAPGPQSGAFPQGSFVPPGGYPQR